MTEILVQTTSAYPVLVGHGLLKEAGVLLKSYLKGETLCIVSDDKVNALHGDLLENKLRQAGYHTIRFVFPAGENSKNGNTYLELLSFLAQNGLSRSDGIVALGGGVAGDLAGFAAATYLRGVPFAQIPTSLLAMVDSSVGGKTAIDLPQGKNLVGAFYQPKVVLCDIDLLETLPRTAFLDGCAEVIKYGVIGNKPLFDLLAMEGPAFDREEVIACCIRQKADVVAGDETDNGLRQLLNLGHTIGHAIERCSDLAWSHGRAVAAGMAIVVRSAVKAGFCSAADAVRLEAVLRKFDLPVQCEFSAAQLAVAALSDKKRRGGSLTLVMPFGIGDTRLHPIPVTELEAFLEGGLQL